MAKEITVFKRYELKYLLTEEQYVSLKKIMSEYMKPDEYGRSTIYNIYYDTPSFLLIRRSIEKPLYKEKLRIRSYGPAGRDKKIFLELKKKHEGITYKRRLSTTMNQLEDYLAGNGSMPDTQIGHEIDYFVNMYRPLSPAVFLSYEREAYFGINDGSFRMTFDRNIFWRDTDMEMDRGTQGDAILDDVHPVLLEVKLAHSFPLWLTNFFTENKLQRTAFSKYGHAYKRMTGQEARADGTISGSVKEKLGL